MGDISKKDVLEAFAKYVIEKMEIVNYVKKVMDMKKIRKYVKNVKKGNANPMIK